MSLVLTKIKRDRNVEERVSSYNYIEKLKEAYKNASDKICTYEVSSINDAIDFYEITSTLTASINRKIASLSSHLPSLPDSSYALDKDIPPSVKISYKDGVYHYIFDDLLPHRMVTDERKKPAVVFLLTTGTIYTADTRIR